MFFVGLVMFIVGMVSVGNEVGIVMFMLIFVGLVVFLFGFVFGGWKGVVFWVVKFKNGNVWFVGVSKEYFVLLLLYF